MNLDHVCVDRDPYTQFTTFTTLIDAILNDDSSFHLSVALDTSMAPETDDNEHSIITHECSRRSRFDGLSLYSLC